MSQGLEAAAERASKDLRSSEGSSGTKTEKVAGHGFGAELGIWAPWALR